MPNLPIHRLDDDTSDLVGIGVGGRSSVLEVAFALLCTLSGHSDRGASIGNAPSELLET